MIWVPVAIAVVLPFAALVLGMVRFPRDAVASIMYAQVFVYLFGAPAIAAGQLPSLSAVRYVGLMSWAAALFAVPFLTTYLLYVRKAVATESGRPGVLVLRAVPALLWGTANAVLAIGYLYVALSRGLLYRRLGWEGIAAAQLDLTLIEFAFYRGFLELAPFLAIFGLVALRLTGDGHGLSRLVWRLSTTLVAGTYALHALVNSRLWAGLFVGAIVSVLALTRRRRAGIRPERAVLAIVAILAVGYSMGVAERVRTQVAGGGEVLAISNFLPGGRSQRSEEGLEWRLNGIDLMATIADNVEAQGPAMGAAWAIPLTLSLDPLVRTDFTESLKRAAFTTAKSYLLLRYAGIGVPDYYSSMVADSYGNFGLPGIALVAVVVALVCAFVSRSFLQRTRPSAVLLACFGLTRILPFEQEFATLLFGWIKLFPVLVAILAFNPLGRHSLQTRLRLRD